MKKVVGEESANEVSTVSNQVGCEAYLKQQRFEYRGVNICEKKISKAGNLQLKYLSSQVLSYQGCFSPADRAVLTANYHR